MVDTPKSKSNSPQIKICGFTRIDEACACAALGVDAIGLVFYAPSPRNVDDLQARDICRALPPTIAKVGVFVNATVSEIMHKVDFCGLTAVQLHGREPPETVERLRQEKLLVIKAFFAGGQPSPADADQYPASAFLMECAQGKLPGGNAQVWDWQSARPFGDHYPLILAGGLAPQNVSSAIESACPHAVDVSSGVESAPGRKDITRIRSFLAATGNSNCKLNKRRIFNA